MGVAHLTQRLFLMLLISNLQGFRGVTLLLSPFIQRVLLALCSVFLGRGLPSMGSTYNLAHHILTKASKSWVCMTNN
jgi:hypothetical protein